MNLMEIEGIVIGITHDRKHFLPGSQGGIFVLLYSAEGYSDVDSLD
jgi:hypothetical protein